MPTVSHFGHVSTQRAALRPHDHLAVLVIIVSEPPPRPPQQPLSRSVLRPMRLRAPSHRSVTGELAVLSPGELGTSGMVLSTFLCCVAPLSFLYPFPQEEVSGLFCKVSAS